MFVSLCDTRCAFGLSCTEFVYPECWNFDNGTSRKIDDVVAKDGGLLYALPLAVHLKSFLQKLPYTF